MKVKVQETAADSSSGSSSSSSSSSDDDSSSSDSSSSSSSDSSGDSSIDDDGGDTEPTSTASLVKGTFETSDSSSGDERSPQRPKPEKRTLKPTALGKKASSVEEDDIDNADLLPPPRTHSPLKREAHSITPQSSNEKLPIAPPPPRSHSPLKREAHSITPQSSNEKLPIPPSKKKPGWSEVLKKKEVKSPTEDEAKPTEEVREEVVQESKEKPVKTDSVDSSTLSEMQKDIRKQTVRNRKKDAESTNSKDEDTKVDEKNEPKKRGFFAFFGRKEANSPKEKDEESLPELPSTPKTVDERASPRHDKSFESDIEDQHPAHHSLASVESQILHETQETRRRMVTIPVLLALLCCYSIFILGVGIGTTYLATDLVVDNTKPVDPTPAPTMAPTIPETPAPTDDPLDLICPAENIPIGFKITFDSEPRDVGIILREEGFGGPRVWSFLAGSFSSFTLFQRENYFLTCLPPGENFIFTISDVNGDGLQAGISAGSNVYGRWELAYNGENVGTYHGDCSLAGFDYCGAYQNCEFLLSRNNTSGTCNTA